MRNARLRKIAIASTAAAALMTLVAACSTAPATDSNAPTTCTKTVTLGAVESLSGTYAALGATIIGSVAVAVHDVNEKGFIVNGECYKFDLVQADAQSTPAGAALAATKVAQSGAKFVFGPTETPEALGGQPGIKAAGAMWFTGSTVVAQSLLDGAYKTDQLYANTFGVLEPAGVLSKDIATYAKVLLPDAKTAALLLPNAATAAPYVSFLTQYLKDQGITVVKSTLYASTATDFTSDLTAIKALKPDILVTGTSSNVEVKTVASEMETLGGVARALMATIGNPDIGLTGNNGKPLSFPFAYANSGSVNVVDKPQTLVDYLARFKDVTGAAVPDAYTNLSTTQWPAVQLLALAMSKAGTVTDVAKIQDALFQVSLTNDPGFPDKVLKVSPDHLLKYPDTVGVVINGVGQPQVVVPGT